MLSNSSQAHRIQEAILKIRDFVKQVSGFEPSQAEIADALNRYFVLKEINDHIVMARSQGTAEMEA